jgi:hypothetical protein
MRVPRRLIPDCPMVQQIRSLPTALAEEKICVSTPPSLPGAFD